MALNGGPPLDETAEAAARRRLASGIRFDSVVLLLGMPAERASDAKREEALWCIEPADAVCLVEKLARFVTMQRDEALRSGHQGAQAAQGPLALFPLLRLAGGEAFAYPDTLAEIARIARDCAIPVDVATDGLWAVSAAAADAGLAPLGGAVQVLSIQSCASQLRDSGFAHVEHLLAACRRHGIQATMTCIVSEEAPFPREMLDSPVLSGDTTVLRLWPEVADTPAERTSVRPPMTPGPRRYTRCRDLFALTIASDGAVYPCAGSVGASAMSAGNALHGDLREILARLLEKRDLRRLSEQGPYAIYERWRNSPESDAIAPGYYDSCEFHRHALAAFSQVGSVQ